MKHAVFSVSLIAVFCLASIQGVYADANTKMSLETGLEYYTGKFGTDHPTDILYVPVTGKIHSKEWTLKMTIPYIEITGANNVVGRLGQTVGTATHTHIVRAGMGDWVVSATRNIFNNGYNGFALNLTGKVKIAMADSAKGLGSGKNDYALETTLFRPSRRFTTFGTLGYKNYGSPEAYTLNNVFYGSLGGSYRFNRTTSGGAMLVAGERIMANRSNRAEAIFFFSHKLGKQWKTQGYMLKGFTDSVPNWGGGILIDYMFDIKQGPAGPDTGDA